MTCKEATKWVVIRESKPIRLHTWVALQLHLIECVNCRRFTKQSKLIHQALQSGQAGHLQEEGLSIEAKSRISNALKNLDDR